MPSVGREPPSASLLSLAARDWLVLLVPFASVKKPPRGEEGKRWRLTVTKEAGVLINVATLKSCQRTGADVMTVRAAHVRGTLTLSGSSVGGFVFFLCRLKTALY